MEKYSARLPDGVNRDAVVSQLQVLQSIRPGILIFDQVSSSDDVISFEIEASDDQKAIYLSEVVVLLGGPAALLPPSSIPEVSPIPTAA